ncbi:MAG: hypothetical protein C5B59_20575 [Bacteroidetes bacterium]|nr:MAG: hypothetical protein C5B59_20575 [Bacteroidota bacterium]
MKKLLPLALLICAWAFSLHSNAQEKPYPIGEAIRKARLSMKMGEDSIKGYVRGQSDSTLLFANKRSLLHDRNLDQPEIRTISYKEINEIYVHRKNSVGRGIGYGALIGCAVGALVGAITYQEPPPGPFQIMPTSRGENAIAGAVLGTATGMLTGALIGALAHKKFIIHGKKERFQHMQKKTGILP